MKAIVILMLLGLAMVPSVLADPLPVETCTTEEGFTGIKAEGENNPCWPIGDLVGTCEGGIQVGFKCIDSEFILGIVLHIVEDCLDGPNFPPGPGGIC